MTRQDFIARLRAGLAGLPAQAQADIVADYETHFTEGAAAGRSEADIAAALGDPDRLARELRTEAGAEALADRAQPGGRRRGGVRGAGPGRDRRADPAADPGGRGQRALRLLHRRRSCSSSSARWCCATGPLGQPARRRSAAQMLGGLGLMAGVGGRRRGADADLDRPRQRARSGTGACTTSC